MAGPRLCGARSRAAETRWQTGERASLVSGDPDPAQTAPALRAMPVPIPLVHFQLQPLTGRDYLPALSFVGNEPGAQDCVTLDDLVETRLQHLRVNVALQLQEQRNVVISRR